MLFDSTVVIDSLNGIPAATRLLASDGSPAVSVVTYIEVLAGVPTLTAERQARAYARAQCAPAFEDVAEEAIAISPRAAVSSFQTRSSTPRPACTG